MQYNPVKVPSTVFNNKLYAIMQAVATEYGLEMNITRRAYGSHGDVYQIVRFNDGTHDDLNPFTTRQTKEEVHCQIETLRKTSSNLRELTVLGEKPRQFFNSREDMEAYFAHLETLIRENVAQRVDTAQEEG